MAFVSTLIGETVMGNKRVRYGTFTNAGGDTGGEVVTGLAHIESIQLTLTGSAVGANAPAVNETFPLSKSDVTIVTDDGADGLWVAFGN